LAFRRYKYYNEINPEYKKSDVGALASALAYTIGQRVIVFEKLNFNNYIAVLQFCIDWHTTHPYNFNKQFVDTALYNKMTSDFISFRQKAIDNKNDIVNKSTNEKATFFNNYELYITELTNIIEQTKKEIKRLQ
jgi:hypothetical protein